MEEGMEGDDGEVDDDDEDGQSEEEEYEVEQDEEDSDEEEALRWVNLAHWKSLCFLHIINISEYFQGGYLQFKASTLLYSCSVAPLPPESTILLRHSDPAVTQALCRFEGWMSLLW